MWPSSCCRPTNSSATHSADDRVREQRHDHRGERAEDRADVGDELHHPVEHPERERVLAPVGEDPDQPEHIQRQAGGGAHQHAEQAAGRRRSARPRAGRASGSRRRACRRRRASRGARARRCARRRRACRRTARTRARGRRSRSPLRSAGRRRTRRICWRSWRLCPGCVCSAVLPCLTMFKWMPVPFEVALEARDRLVGFVDDMRKIVA